MKKKYLFGLSTIGLFGNSHQCGGYFVANNEDLESWKHQLGLRPIVSIDLKASGCTMTQEKSTDGKITYKLSWTES